MLRTSITSSDSPQSAPSRNARERPHAARAGDVERRLAILLAATAEHRTVHAAEIRRLTALADFRWLAEAFDRARLLPLLGGRLIDASPQAVPDTFRDALEVALAHSRRRAALVEQLALLVVHALEEAAISVVALKGPHLAERLYGDAAMRTSNDIDLLVRSEDFHRAAEVLEGTGYRSEGKAPWQNGLPLFEASLRAHEAWRPPIDLHWRLHWYEERYSRCFIRRCEVDERGVRVPQRLDELTALLLFWSRDGLGGLRHAADVGAWWDRHGRDLPAGALDEIAAVHSSLRPSLTAAALQAERSVGVPAHRLLSGADCPGRRVRLAVRCANLASPSTRLEAEASVALMDALLTPRGGGRAFVRRHLLLPSVVIADIYGLPPTARLRRGLRRVYFAARVGTQLGLGSAASLCRALLQEARLLRPRP